MNRIALAVALCVCGPAFAGPLFSENGWIVSAETGGCLALHDLGDSGQTAGLLSTGQDENAIAFAGSMFAQPGAIVLNGVTFGTARPDPNEPLVLAPISDDELRVLAFSGDANGIVMIRYGSAQGYVNAPTMRVIEGLIACRNSIPS